MRTSYLENDLIKLRREFHSQPELNFDVTETSKKIESNFLKFIIFPNYVYSTWNLNWSLEKTEWVENSTWLKSYTIFSTKDLTFLLVPEVEMRSPTLVTWVVIQNSEPKSWEERHWLSIFSQVVSLLLRLEV